LYIVPNIDFQPAQAVSSTQSTVEDTPADNTIDQEAKLFVTHFWAGWSQPNPIALSYIPTVFADPIIFYGKSISLKSFMELQTAFADRWPNRTYTLQPSSLVTSCDQKSSICQLSGIVNWITDSPARRAHSVGSASFELKALVKNSAGEDQFVITEETGSVISRTLTAGNSYVPPQPTQTAGSKVGDSDDDTAAVNTAPSEPVFANPPKEIMTFSDPLGIAYANLAETTWTTNKTYDEMTDETVVTVVSVQENDTGAAAEIDGTCSNGVVTFTATITDGSGQPTVNLANGTLADDDVDSGAIFANVQDMIRGMTGAIGYVQGELRINSQPENQNAFLLFEYNNTPQIAQLSIGGSPNNAFGFGGKLDLTTTWRILAELDTDHGPIIIKIPIYDPQVENFLQACVPGLGQ
jgi:hypothetical protein